MELFKCSINAQESLKRSKEGKSKGGANTANSKIMIHTKN